MVEPLVLRLFSRKYAEFTRSAVLLFEGQLYPTWVESRKEGKMLRQLGFFIASASIVATPAQVSAASLNSAEVRTGSFVGAQFKLSLGGKSVSKPRALLGIAPTLSRTSGGLVVKTSIGEGIALNLSRKPTLTLAGVPADQALGLASSKEVDAKRRKNLSTGGWIAVGTGALAVAAGLIYLTLVDIAEHDED